MTLSKKPLAPPCRGLRSLKPHQRLQKLKDLGFLSERDLEFFKDSLGDEAKVVVGAQLSDNFIENSIGYWDMPLGVATHFIINSKSYAVPMAVEESSIIAAASSGAKWVSGSGGSIKAWPEGSGCVTGQLHVPDIGPLSLGAFVGQVKTHSLEWQQAINEQVLSGLVKRGGGCKDIEVRALPGSSLVGGIDGESKCGVGEVMCEDGGAIEASWSRRSLVVEVHVDTCDAQGANLINQACEFIKPYVQALGVRVGMAIVSNLCAQKCIRAVVEVPGVAPGLGKGLEEASQFAKQDPARACTHNKGILNAVDAILIATGNDWRAVEAGAHAFAARTGQYKGLSTWHYGADSTLRGQMLLPMGLGLVGGVTRLHPKARGCLSMLGVSTAQELAQVCAGVGLVQNLSALRALVTDGIIKGHMALHINNIVMQVEPREDLRAPLKVFLQNELAQKGFVSASVAKEFLNAQKQPVHNT